MSREQASKGSKVLANSSRASNAPAGARKPAPKKKPAPKRKRAPRKKRSKEAIAAAKRKREEARRLRAERKAELLQSQQFSKAASLFNAGKFGMAKRVLKRVETGPNAALGHRARIYLAICRKKAARKRPILKTVDDFYNHAVLLFNDGDYKAAVRVLNRGLRKDQTAAHLHYVKAVAKVLLGQRTGALIPLKKAIALDPDIRIRALLDPDLQSVIRRHPFSKLVSEDDA